MKRSLPFTLAMTFLLVLTFSTSTNARTIQLKMSTAVPSTSHWQIGAEEFAKIIEEKTDGKYKIRIFSNDELSGGNQVVGIEMVQQGSTDLHMHDALLWSVVNPKIAVVSFPFLLPSLQKVDDIMEKGEGSEIIADLLSKSGVICLGIGEAGHRQIVNKKRSIEKPADLKGLKLRVPGIAMYVDLFKILGADPIAMNQSEVYTSLQQGAIDGAENTSDLLITQNTLEVVDYITFWNYSYDPVLFTASRKLWKSLSEEEKKIFLAAGKEAMAKQKAAKRALDAKYDKMIRNNYNLNVTTLTPEQKSAFRKASAPIYQKYKDTIGEELFEKFGYSF